jgi:hypothetical protein
VQAPAIGQEEVKREKAERIYNTHKKTRKKRDGGVYFNGCYWWDVGGEDKTADRCQAVGRRRRRRRSQF